MITEGVTAEPIEIVDDTAPAEEGLVTIPVAVGETEELPEVDEVPVDDIDFLDFEALTPEQEGLAVKAMEVEAPEETAALRQEWGADFKANIAFAVAYARSAIQEDPALAEALNESRLGNHPAFIRFAARRGRLAAGDPGNPRTVTMAQAKGANGMAEQMTKSGAEDRLEDLTAQIHDAMNRGDRRKALKLQDERSRVADALSAGDDDMIPRGPGQDGNMGFNR